jgi:hypothetical protein
MPLKEPELRPPASQLPIGLLLLAAWMLPGMGHLLLRRRARAVVFALVVAVGFVLGIVLEGELFVPKPGDPLSYLATIASLGNGVLFVAARLLDLGQGVVTAPSYEFGNTFLLTAGMMNLLLVLDTHDIAVGKKDW